MFNGGLVLCSMRLGVPFIAPRQLGVVGSLFGRQFWPSIGWRTRQSGAPPDMNSAWFLSFSGEADCWALGPLGAPDSTVRPGDRWLSTCVARWSRCRPLARALMAHRIVWWILATTPLTILESREFAVEPVCAPDSPVHRRLVQVWLDLATLLQSNLIWLDKVPST
jgi:hypothetical protein